MLENITAPYEITEAVYNALINEINSKPTDNSYISGLQGVWVSGAALTIKTGRAYAENGTFINVTADIAKTGLSLTANTWYHVYLFINGSDQPDIQVVTDAPVIYNGTARSKTGATTHRYILSVKTGSGGGGLLLGFFNPSSSCISLSAPQ